ncbi:MAG: ThuA domain-containing protein [Christensenellales bacterium]|jgi:trehalose utilization protein
MSQPIRVTVWNEFRHEKTDEAVKAVYPEGIHAYIASFLGQDADFTVRTATLDEPEHGLTEQVLDETDVLMWWGHIAHDEVQDAIVERVAKRVYAGMGLIVLHSGHASKIFSKLLGTPTGMLRWYEKDTKERLWVVSPGHRIVQGVGDYIDIPHDETYGELFHIPEPDHLVFITWYPGGEVFRGGCCFVRGAGHIFYFQPGHETCPVYHHPQVQQVLKNAIHWAAPAGEGFAYQTGHAEPIEEI